MYSRVSEDKMIRVYIKIQSTVEFSLILGSGVGATVVDSHDEMLCRLGTLIWGTINANVSCTVKASLIGANDTP